MTRIQGATGQLALDATVVFYAFCFAGAAFVASTQFWTTLDREKHSLQQLRNAGFRISPAYRRFGIERDIGDLQHLVGFGTFKVGFPFLAKARRLSAHELRSLIDLSRRIDELSLGAIDFATSIQQSWVRWFP